MVVIVDYYCSYSCSGSGGGGISGSIDMSQTNHG